VRQNGARPKRAASTRKRDWYAHSHVASAASMLAQRFSMDCSRSAMSLLRVAITRAAAAAVAVTAVAAVESGKLPLWALPPVPPVRPGGDACHGCTPRPLPTAGCGGVRSRLLGGDCAHQKQRPRRAHLRCVRVCKCNLCLPLASMRGELRSRGLCVRALVVRNVFRINQAQTHNMTHLWVEVASWLPALLFPPILALGGRREGLPRPREAAPQRSALLASSSSTSRCRLRRRSGRAL
jgi:hypothetical protein